MAVSVAFDQSLQEELACLVLTNAGFASKFNNYVLESEEIKKKRIQVFTNLHIDRIVKLYNFIARKSKGFYPSEGIMLSEIDKLSISVGERESMKKTYRDLKKKNIQFNESYNGYLKEFVTVVKTSILIESIIKKTEGRIDNKTLFDINDEIRKHSSSLDELRFASSNIINMGDMFGIIEEYADSVYQNIPTGVKELDDNLNGGGEIGGLARGEVTAVLSGTNDGKSFVVNGIGCNAVARGFSVAEFAFEGKKLQTPVRAVSNLAKLPSKRIQAYRAHKAKNKDANASAFFSQDEIKRIEEAEKIAKDRFFVIHAIKDSNIEHIKHQAIEMHRVKPFDLIIIDYGQLVESMKKFIKEHDLLMYVFREFEKLAAELNVAIVIAMQVNRDGIKELSDEVANGNQYPVYKLSHVAGGYSTLKTTGCVIAVSRTLEERVKGLARFTIIKQREGLVGVEVGIRANFELADMFIGERYRYFHPIESALGVKSDIFDTKSSSSQVGENSLQGVEEIRVAINNDTFFKGLWNLGINNLSEFTESLQKLVVINANLDETSNALKLRGEGKKDMDMEEVMSYETSFAELTRDKAEILNSDNWLFSHSGSVRKIAPFVNKIEDHSQKELFKIILKGEFPDFQKLKDNLELIGLIKLAKVKIDR